MRWVAGLASVLGSFVVLSATAEANHWHEKHAGYGDCCSSDFSGVYAGISLGYANASSEITNEIVDNIAPAYIFTRDDIGADDVVGAVTLGYDRQIGSGIVVGVFGDYTFGELSSNVSLTAGANLDLEVSDMWAVGGRLGVVMRGGMLIFATAGYTEADLEFEGQSFDLDGYFVGGGIEHELGRGFYLKAEYRYADYGDTRLFQSSSFCCSETLDSETDVHSIRLGVNYKFGRRDEPSAPLK